jgi:hypothetical protein
MDKNKQEFIELTRQIKEQYTEVKHDKKELKKLTLIFDDLCNDCEVECHECYLGGELEYSICNELDDVLFEVKNE